MPEIIADVAQDRESVRTIWSSVASCKSARGRQDERPNKLPLDQSSLAICFVSASTLLLNGLNTAPFRPVQDQVVDPFRLFLPSS